MLLRRSWPLLVFALILVVWFGTRPGRLTAQDPTKLTTKDTIPGFPKSLGSASCSASNCHGGIEPTASRRIRSDEYTIWLRQDPHSDAYAALSNPLGKQIAQRLGIGDATKARDCLGCHVNPGLLVHDDLAANTELLAEGVSCEACHGPAEKWLPIHSKVGLKDQNAMFWMTPIVAGNHAQRPDEFNPLRIRALLCPGCHVGGPGRDMNHDMIAAGHPRLNFEYTAYMANMPPHWRKVTPPDAKSWAIGRAAAATAAAGLLAARSAPTSPERPWPEFAEHDCFACHHDLVSPSFRQSRGSPHRVPGSFLANDWHTAWLHEALSGLPQKDTAVAREQVIALQGLLSTRSPDRAKIHVAATELRETLGKLAGDLESWSPTEQDNQAARGILAKGLKHDGSSPASWDRTAQLYFALLALNHGKPDATSDELLKLLRFDPGFDSPRHKFPPFPTKP